MDKFFNAVGKFTVAVAVIIAVLTSFCSLIHAIHARNCEGQKTGKCDWAWCSYYDGSDYLHDFNF